MTKPNIPLVRPAKIAEYEKIQMTAQKPCECTEAMIANKDLDDDMCKPCAARQVLNGIVTLAAKL